MRNAETVLAVIRERGKKRQPLVDLYRQLFNPDLYLRAYGRISRNDGALTPGVTSETVDGMSQTKIQAIIEAIRQERYRWTPVRRIYIEKRSSTAKRPLGIPSWSDKLLQEVIRSLLEAYYEPQFSEHSHGFRPGRGCHTALQQIDQTWLGTTWFIEGDIRGCFDTIDHPVLLSILAESIQDQRFLRLIRNLLQAGYLENWQYARTLSGAPQGGILSPLLANVYLDRLDRFIETELLPTYNRGARRQHDPHYHSLSCKARYLRRMGRPEEARTLRKQAQALPSIDLTDPTYRRLRYLRYADDFLLGFTGPISEAEAIKARIGAFLHEHLKLELSAAKTLITHARAEPARFLGYEITVLHRDQKRVNHGRYKGRRAINGQIALKVPEIVIREKCRPYLQAGKPIHRPERTNDAVFSIVAQFQAEWRGIAQYYQLAQNRHRLDRLRWTMECSLVKTLARKLKISGAAIRRKYQAVIPTEDGPRKVLQVTVERGEGKAPLRAQWGGISLQTNRHAILDDHPSEVRNKGTELLERLLADACELCGSRQAVQVHHIKRLVNLRRPDRAERPTWKKWMIARQRKTIVLCRSCHYAAHAGQPRRRHSLGTDHWRAG